MRCSSKTSSHVTHVSEQNCHPCSELHTVAMTIGSSMTMSIAMASSMSTSMPMAAAMFDVDGVVDVGSAALSGLVGRQIRRGSSVHRLRAGTASARRSVRPRRPEAGGPPEFPCPLAFPTSPSTATVSP